MHAHTPPFTAKTAKQVYDETSIKAAAQDARLDPISDVESKVRTAMQYLYHAQLLLKEAFPYTSGERVKKSPESVHVNAPKWSPQRLAGQGLPAESAYLASFSPNGSRIATSAEVDGLRDVLTAEELKGFGIGDVERRHPMHAEVLRDEFERADKETGV